MKKYKFLLAFFCISFLSPQIVKAQWLHIDSLKLLPANPTNTDTVKVICYTTIFNSPCRLDSSTVIINDFDVTINACYVYGIATLFCHTSDTLVIGRLNAGNYRLIYNARFCSDTISASPDTLNFTILINNVITMSKPYRHLELFPNPFHIYTKLKVNFTTPQYAMLVIYDITGREERKQYIIKNETVILSEGLKEGVYFLKVFNDNEYISTVILMVN